MSGVESASSRSHVGRLLRRVGAGVGIDAATVDATVDGLQMGVQVRVLRPGEVLLEAGPAPQQVVWLLAEGSCHLVHEAAHGERVAWLVRAPVLIGADAVLGGRGASLLTARAVLPCEALGFSPQRFEECLRQGGALAVLLMRLCMSRTAGLLEQLQMLATASAEQRVCRYLALHAHRDARGDRVVVVPGSHKDLAALLCLTPETLSRVLRRLRESGQLVDGGERMLLRAPARRRRRHRPPGPGPAP